MVKANKISLNASKTELIFFHHPTKSIDYDVKIKIDDKKCLPWKHGKYSGIAIDSVTLCTLCNR